MKKIIFPKTSRFHSSIFIIGFSAVITQIILMRELLVIFHGNELSIGIILFIWLICTSFGSGLFSKFINSRYNNTGKIYHVAQAAYSFSLPLALILIRGARPLFNLIPGEVAGITQLLSITLLILAPVCILSGLLYTLTCRASHAHPSAIHTISRVYLAETAGSAVGGLLFSLCLISLFSSPVNILILFILNIVMFLANISTKWPGTISSKRLIILIAATISCLCLWIYAPAIQYWYENTGFEIGEPIASVHTPYGNIKVLQLGDQYTFYENGLVAFTVPDEMHSEGTVHLTLLEHPDPKRILLLGGTLGGSISETLKHPTVDSVVYVARDPRLISLALRILPLNEKKIFNDPRVHIQIDDGRRFIQKTDTRFDVIISNYPAPSTARLNRFYTLEFFQEVKKILNPDGIFSLKIPVSENALSDEEAEFLSIIAATAAAVFPCQILLPGEPVRLIAVKGQNRLSSAATDLIKILKERRISTIYIQDYYIHDQLSTERKAYLDSRLKPVEQEQLNRDFKPVGYYSNTILWSTKFAGNMTPLFLKLKNIKITTVMISILIAAVLLMLYLIHKLFKHKNSHTWPIALSILCVGFSEISLELILIIMFQILFGFAYYQLAMIIAGYMLGLMAGSLYIMSATKSTQKTERLMLLFSRNQIYMTIYPILIFAILYILRSSYFTITTHFPETLLFGLLALFAGFIGGSQFPLANLIFLKKKRPIGKTASRLYSLDLMGSAAGALLTGALLIPLLSIPVVLVLLAFFNLIAFILLPAAVQK